MRRLTGLLTVVCDGCIGNGAAGQVESDMLTGMKGEVSSNTRQSFRMKATDVWASGCWCAAALKLCDERIEWEADDGVRFPEQWMFVVWRPMTQPFPFVRPDGWGLSIGHPKQQLVKMIPPSDTVYILQDRECLWSAWLSIPLVCERYEPWLTSAIETAQAQQRSAEQSRWAQWYGNEQGRFQKFISQVISTKST